MSGLAGDEMAGARRELAALLSLKALYLPRCLEDGCDNLVEYDRPGEGVLRVAAFLDREHFERDCPGREPRRMEFGELLDSVLDDPGKAGLGIRGGRGWLELGRLELALLRDEVRELSRRAAFN